MIQPKDLLYNNGFVPFGDSFRAFSNEKSLCVVHKNKKEYIVLIENLCSKIPLNNVVDDFEFDNKFMRIFTLDWVNYKTLKDTFPIEPVKEKTEKNYEINESDLKNNVDFLDLMLEIILDVLKSGYIGDFSAVAKGISSEKNKALAIKAGFLLE